MSPNDNSVSSLTVRETSSHLLTSGTILTAIAPKASSDKKQLDVGANLFAGNLDENMDERLL